MVAFDITAAIDAIVTDLAAQRVALGLPTYSVQKYVQPLWVSGEMQQPLLAVYLAEVDPRVESTSGEYLWTHRICVGWFESVPDSLNTGQVDNTQAGGIIRRVQTLYRYMSGTYFAGIPGYSPNPESEMTIHKIRFGRPMGGVYGGEVDLRVADWF